MMEKSLVMSFETETGAKVSITVKDIKDGLTEGVCNEVMDNIIASNVISTSKGELKAKKSCEIIEKETTQFVIA